MQQAPCSPRRRPPPPSRAPAPLSCRRLVRPRRQARAPRAQSQIWDERGTTNSYDERRVLLLTWRGVARPAGGQGGWRAERARAAARRDSRASARSPIRRCAPPVRTACVQHTHARTLGRGQRCARCERALLPPSSPTASAYRRPRTRPRGACDAACRRAPHRRAPRALAARLRGGQSHFVTPPAPSRRARALRTRWRSTAWSWSWSAPARWRAGAARGAAPGAAPCVTQHDSGEAEDPRTAAWSS
jgi:hypothetical protein